MQYAVCWMLRRIKSLLSNACSLVERWGVVHKTELVSAKRGKNLEAQGAETIEEISARWRDRHGYTEIVLNCVFGDS